MSAITTDLPSRVEESLAACPRYAAAYPSSRDHSPESHPSAFPGFGSSLSEMFEFSSSPSIRGLTTVQTGVGKSSLISNVFNISLIVRKV